MKPVNWTYKKGPAQFELRFLLFLFCATAIGLAAAQASDSAVSERHHGAFGIGTWKTAAEFKDIVVTSNGVTLYRSDSQNQGTNDSILLDGDWSFTNGVFRQSAILPHCRLFLGNTNWADYTVSLRARKTGGDEGFFVFVNSFDVNNFTSFNVGGWTNTLASVDRQTSAGQWTLCDRIPLAIKSNVWYEVRLELHGARIDCYVDSKLIQTGIYSEPPPPVTVAGTLGAESTQTDIKRNNAALRAVFGDPVCQGGIGFGSYDRFCPL